MKAILFLAMLATAGFSVAAQNCAGYYYLKSKEVQMTTFDRKGKESGKLTYTISGVATSGHETSARFVSEMKDEKGKLLSRGAGKYKCNGSSLFVDARVAMPQEQLSAYRDMEVQAEDAFIEYPSSMLAGQSLKDVDFKMDIINKGSLFSTTTLQQTNRKIEQKEGVTTAAGSWDCWKISYDARFRATIGGPNGIGIPVTFRCTEWFAPGFGIVKTETYNKNGKLVGSTLITSVK